MTTRRLLLGSVGVIDGDGVIAKLELPVDHLTTHGYRGAARSPDA